jgi:chemotaxis protein methyltransferase CheR
MAISGTAPSPLREKETANLTAENYAFLERYIQQETGIALGPDKQYLLESRLMAVLQEERLGSLNELSLRLPRPVPVTMRRRIAECMTTHETLFFRDPAVFDVLRADLVPELAAKRRAEKTLRIWCAACSSGQEPYSLAMLLFEAGYGDWKLEILGTDLSSRILDRAAAGRYLQIEVNRGLPAPLLVKYFQRAGLEWQLREEIRRVIRFQQFDLRQSMMELGPFDFVLCRNVLIYFDMPTRKRILAEIHGRLLPEGYLLLGASETTFNLEDRFLRKTVRATVTYQRPPAGGKL